MQLNEKYNESLIVFNEKDFLTKVKEKQIMISKKQKQ